MLSHSTIISADLNEWLQKTPKLTTYRVNLLKTTAQSLIDDLNRYFLKYEADDRPKIREIFPDTIGIDCWPESYVEQIVNKDRSEVVVDAACGAAVLRGSHVFAPAVMALPTDINLNDEVAIFADIAGQCKKGLKVNYDGPKRFVGVGRLKMTRNQLYGSSNPKGIAIETIMPESGIPVIDDVFAPDSCLLQNLPSIVCTRVLNPQRGETILDMCAAPGNKTSHIAEIMQNDGIIIALDRSNARIKQVGIKCTERSITNVLSFDFDSTKAVSIDGNADVRAGPPFVPESFDRILLDAPCSALGQRPLLKNTSSLSALKSHPALQKKLFRSAVALLKKQGVLVYSTCTVLADECESMVAWALKSFPELSLVPAAPSIGGPGWAGFGLTDDERSMLQRFGPVNTSDREAYDTIGFFIACFKKQ